MSLEWHISFFAGRLSAYFSLSHRWFLPGEWKVSRFAKVPITKRFLSLLLILLIKSTRSLLHLTPWTTFCWHPVHLSQQRLRQFALLTMSQHRFGRVNISLFIIVLTQCSTLTLSEEYLALIFLIWYWCCKSIHQYLFILLSRLIFMYKVPYFLGWFLHHGPCNVLFITWIKFLPNIRIALRMLLMKLRDSSLLHLR